MYELNAQDVLLALEHQLSMTEFDGHCEYTPYEEFNHSGHCVLSNLMLGFWANCEAVRFLLV